jgi:hypothetical protein
MHAAVALRQLLTLRAASRVAEQLQLLGAQQGCQPRDGAHSASAAAAAAAASTCHMVLRSRCPVWQRRSRCQRLEGWHVQQGCGHDAELAPRKHSGPGWLVSDCPIERLLVHDGVLSKLHHAAGSLSWSRRALLGPQQPQASG